MNITTTIDIAKKKTKRNGTNTYGTTTYNVNTFIPG